MFVSQDTGRNKTLNLGYSGPGLLTIFKGFLTTYCRHSSLERMKNFWSLLALLDSNYQGTVVSVRPSITPSPFNNNQVENSQIGNHRTSTNGPVFTFSSSPWSIARKPLTQQQACCVEGHDTLLHGKTLFVVLADSDRITFPLFTWSSGSYFCDRVLLNRKYKVCVCCPPSDSSGAGKKMCSFVLIKLTT